MVRAQLTSTITMSSRDRSETITRGFAAGLARPSRVARRAADPVVVMDAPRPCRSTVLRFGPGRGRPGCRAPIGWARALQLNLGHGRIHPLAVGDGHLLRGEVAALDATEKGHTGLASYYPGRGETPGAWVGSGLDGIDGLVAGDPVTAEQMRALLGCGLHPLAELRQQQLEGSDLTERDFQDAARLGAPFKIVDGDVGPSASRSPNGSGRSRRRPACQRVLPCRPLIGRGCGPRWPGSSSWPSIAGSRWMPGSWRDRSPRTHGHEPRRLL